MQRPFNPDCQHELHESNLVVRSFFWESDGKEMHSTITRRWESCRLCGGAKVLGDECQTEEA